VLVLGDKERSGAPVSGVPVTGAPFGAAADPQEPDEPAGPDPEQILSAYEWHFDPETLREVVDEDEAEELETVRDLLSAKLARIAENAARARLLSLRAVVSRILGELQKAHADGKLALAHAEATGELRRIAIAQARLAHVLQWRGEYEEADRLFALANSTELPDRLRATMHQHAGKCAYDQDRYIEACNHFELAMELRKDEDPELIEQMSLALDAVFRRVAERGWGPYPRAKEQILQIRKPPVPAFDETTRRWGYVAEDGTDALSPRFTDAQPFRDGVAWVQRQGSETWELIDESGHSLIEPTVGYLGVSSFSDGLAWVSRDGVTRWIAIDKANAVLISSGFDDARPFRRGLAAVRRGDQWGAVDGAGRVIVPFKYDGFATAMHDGRYIDGFSDEGLAVVSLDGRKGVVDRSGRLIVTPRYPVLVIHPVAFLLRDERLRWGALDRHGRPLIDAEFPSRITVVEEIDRLLADTRPML
jgi:tetratricopeptide (TPR) repeat protein